MTAFSRPALSRFLILYAALYAGFGVQSPYLPSLLESRDLRPEAIALVLAAGSAVRLVAGPAAGRLADRLDAPKVILSLCSAVAALIALGYLPARGLWLLFAVGVFHSAALAPLAPLSDTLALGAAAAARSDDAVRRGFEYGWVRGAGSAAFILGSVLSGQAVGHFGIASVVWLNAALLATAAFAALLVPQLPPTQDAARATEAKGGVRGVGALLRLPLYRRLVLVAALIMGSHAMHDSFAVIRWAAAGIGPGTAGLLWSLSVAAEVMVFLFAGRPLLDRLGPAGAAALGGNGRDRLAPGACGHRTLARADLRALASDLHAASGGMRSTAPCGDGVNALWHRRHRCPSDAADACLGPALRPFRSARVLGDGGSLRRGVAPRSDAARAF
jgi:PPP family 3-phenylpropionic acid transporter